jgi:hypothetical protein
MHGIANWNEIETELFARLKQEDDPNLWETVAHTVLAQLNGVELDRVRIYAQIGACSHWIRPHGMRWAAGGSFAWPFGYNPTVTGWSYRALPQFDWSVTFEFDGNAWKHVGKRRPRSYLLRIAIPARTARHPQAAVHTVWIPRCPWMPKKVKPIQLFGFRRTEHGWECAGSELLTSK